MKVHAAAECIEAGCEGQYLQKITRPAEFDGLWWLPDFVDTRHLDSDKFQLLSDFRFGTPDGKTYIIKAGFIYDKASVPWLVWWYIPRDDKDIERAALIHDLLYAVQWLDEWLTREYVDQIFHDIMKHDGMRWDKRKAAYAAVRLAGWRFYDPQAKTIGNIHYIEHS